ncbi:transposase [Streptomyces pseudovenezuelae]|uniref:transposase n=1 Tax=Streptomyces pseudovenezuelae TaxID=67350 RepID=UPI003D7ACB73
MGRIELLIAAWKARHPSASGRQRRYDISFSRFLGVQLRYNQPPSTSTTCEFRSRTDESAAPRRSVRVSPTHGRLALCGN